MKSLLRVLFILALFCGVSSFAHADAVDFHVQVLDPSNTCDDNTSLCTIGDPSTPFPVGFLAAACSPFNLPGGPTSGCLVVFNNTTNTPFTNLELTFNLGPNVNPVCSLAGGGLDIFANASCGSSGGVETFFFSGLPGLAPLHEMVIFESGLDPSTVEGVGMVNTPEPESLLLFSTGAMMMAAGAFMSRRRAFAFGKK